MVQKPNCCQIVVECRYFKITSWYSGVPLKFTWLFWLLH